MRPRIAQRKSRQRLARGNTVTEAIYDAGFNSSGRFYEKSTGMLGMTPTQYRAGGCNEEIRFAVGKSSLGAILVASSRKGVASILLGDDPDALVRDLQDRFPNAQLIGADKDYEKLVARVVGFVEAPGFGLDLPLDVRGTAFQQRVWQALAGDSRRPDGRPTRTSRGGSARRKPSAPSPAPALPTILRSRSRVTGWCAMTVRCRATPGAWSASASCSIGNPRAAADSVNHEHRHRDERPV